MLLSTGECTIFIKISDTNTAKPTENLNASASLLNASTDTISSDLDEQINDLLSSIRKEEEDKEHNGTTQGDSNKGDKVDESFNSTNETKVHGNLETEQENTEVEAVDTKTAESELAAVNSESEELTDNKLEEVNDNELELEEAKDKVEVLKNEAKETGRVTPTRASSRIANVTPSSIRTRRASRLAN